MNGEIYNACNIVTAAKIARHSSQEICYNPRSYEKHIEFHFLPKGLLFKKMHKALSVSSWHKEILARGLADIKFLMPSTVKNRNLLGFSGATQMSILCFYQNKKVTSFIPKWSFTEQTKGWNIVYHENLWENPSVGQPKFPNPTTELLRVLQEIEAFARKIEYPVFADMFLQAFQILLTDDVTTATPYPNLQPLDLPSENNKLFLAAQSAYVFGAMGSWNDSPPYAAKEKGLSEEYESLSARLHTQLTSAILYAINEW